MTTCPIMCNKTRRVHDGAHGIVSYEEACGLALTEDGLCPFHDNLPPPAVPLPGPREWTGRDEVVALGFMEREKNRLGSWGKFKSEYRRWK